MKRAVEVLLSDVFDTFTAFDSAANITIEESTLSGDIIYHQMELNNTINHIAHYIVQLLKYINGQNEVIKVETKKKPIDLITSFYSGVNDKINDVTDSLTKATNEFGGRMMIENYLEEIQSLSAKASKHRNHIQDLLK